MEKCAIWKDHKVPGIGVYFGFDRTTRPEKYAESYKQT